MEGNKEVLYCAWHFGDSKVQGHSFTDVAQVYRLHFVVINSNLPHSAFVGLCHATVMHICLHALGCVYCSCLLSQNTALWC